MPTAALIEYDDAASDVREIYDEFRAIHGREVYDDWKAIAIHPATMVRHGGHTGIE